jgi:uncharacterized protein
MMMSLRTKLAACVAFATLFAPSQALAKCDGANGSSAVSYPVGSASSSCSPHLKYTAQQVIDELGLEPNPEGGYYVETFRDPTLGPPGNRSISTAIYYLLEGPDVASRWHRVDAVEIWHWYAGAPMILHISANNGTPTEIHHLGPDVLSGARPQVVIPGGHWQQAISCGNWTLVGTTGKLKINHFIILFELACDVPLPTYSPFLIGLHRTASTNCCKTKKSPQDSFQRVQCWRRLVGNQTPDHELASRQAQVIWTNGRAQTGEGQMRASTYDRSHRKTGTSSLAKPATNRDEGKLLYIQYAARPKIFIVNYIPTCLTLVPTGVHYPKESLACEGLTKTKYLLTICTLIVQYSEPG